MHSACWRSQRPGQRLMVRLRDEALQTPADTAPDGSTLRQELRVSNTASQSSMTRVPQHYGCLGALMCSTYLPCLSHLSIALAECGFGVQAAHAQRER